MSILEAMAYGKPVLGARIGGIPEMVDDGVTGLLFGPGSRDDLRSKLTRFFAMDAGQVETMGRAGRRMVEKQYASPAHYDHLMAVYQRAMAA
jgi:glycosyltransferase involved in cell wall biosynthesis